MLPPSISHSDKFYKVMLVIGKKEYKFRHISGEFPDYINYGNRTLKLKMVLWDCSRKTEGGYTFLKLKCLVYK
jgi:hypothetical protein